MSKSKEKEQPIGNLLYTIESKESAERTKAELAEPDPSPEKVLGVLVPNKNTEEEEKVDESSAS